MKRLMQIILISLSFLLVPSAAYAETEYPWTGSERGAERAGGLGWITVRESLVLPGTEECSVMILQTGDERWGHMAGEEDPDEFLWTVTLYEEDDFTARVQLPYSTYRTCYIGKSAMPDRYASRIPEGRRIEWFLSNDLMLAESGREMPSDVSYSCRLSSEEPEGNLCNDLMMIVMDDDGFSYTEDISDVFAERADDLQCMTDESRGTGQGGRDKDLSPALLITGICSLTVSAILLMLKRRRPVPVFCIAFFALTGIILLIR